MLSQTLTCLQNGVLQELRKGNRVHFKE
uniref:Uncharacterized protein n=1 Tax=Anguilla anguilla TaxID=7936 RepID=A0A0E9VWS3_ANGAN